MTLEAPQGLMLVKNSASSGGGLFWQDNSPLLNAECSSCAFVGNTAVAAGPDQASDILKVCPRDIPGVPDRPEGDVKCARHVAIGFRGAVPLMNPLEAELVDFFGQRVRDPKLGTGLTCKITGPAALEIGGKPSAFTENGLAIHNSTTFSATIGETYRLRMKCRWARCFEPLKIELFSSNYTVDATQDVCTFGEKTVGPKHRAKCTVCKATSFSLPRGSYACYP